MKATKGLGAAFDPPKGPDDVIDRDERLYGTMAVRLKAKACKQSGPDEVTVYIKWEPLTSEQQDFLKKMFPHLADKAGELLDKEMILASLIS
jgi:hypothetical protein